MKTRVCCKYFVPNCRSIPVPIRSFLIFTLIFIVINHITLLTCFFVYFLEYLLLFLDEETNNFQIAKGQPQGFTLLLLAFFANFSLTLLLKVMLIKKGVHS